MSERSRVFLLSPARLDGRRAESLFRPKTKSGIGHRLRSPEGVAIGEVFAFLSGLYFRGKVAYAKKFARPPSGQSWLGSGALVITTNRGLMPAETRICLEHLEAFAGTNIHEAEPEFTRPVTRDAELLAQALGTDGQVVLLGSVASAKYVDVLLRTFGERLLFPSAFVGRGDMSRGGLLLRQVDDGRELDYVPVKGATLRGPRPPKLEPRRRR